MAEKVRRRVCSVRATETEPGFLEYHGEASFSVYSKEHATVKLTFYATANELLAAIARVSRKGPDGLEDLSKGQPFFMEMVGSLEFHGTELGQRQWVGKRCATCKHWGPVVARLNRGVCTKISTADGAASLTDHAELETDGEFRCGLHEKRKVPE